MHPNRIGPPGWAGPLAGLAAIAGLIAAASAPTLAQTQPRSPQKSPQATPNTPLPAEFGVWFDDTGQGAVEILPCETTANPGAPPQRLCGRIVWLKEATDKAGRPLTDGYNPRPALRTRPVCGLQVIGDVKPVRAGAWDQGWIYDPKEGKSYDVEVKLRDANRLAITGYLGVKFLSETFIWTRAPADLPRCDTAVRANAAPAAASPGRQARR